MHWLWGGADVPWQRLVAPAFRAGRGVGVVNDARDLVGAAAAGAAVRPGLDKLHFARRGGMGKGDRRESIERERETSTANQHSQPAKVGWGAHVVPKSTPTQKPLLRWDMTAGVSKKLYVGHGSCFWARF